MKKMILLLILPLTALMAVDFTMTREGLFIETTSVPTLTPIPNPTGSAKTNWGFQGFDIPSPTVTVAAGTNVDIQNAINSLSGGGTVELGSGTFNINDTIRLKSNIVLKGAGRDQTKLKFTGTVSGHPLLQGKDDDHNIILRDFTMDATGMGNLNAIDFLRAVNNILIENIEVYGGGRGNITFYGGPSNISRDITIRNVITHDNYRESLGHGVSFFYSIGVKLENIEAYGIHNGLGIDLAEVNYAEVANANIYDVSQGMKFPGSTHIYLHDITIDDVHPAVTHQGGNIAIRFNRKEFRSQHMHLENITINNAKTSISDWGDAFPAPTFEELVLNNITTTNIYSGVYTYLAKGVNNLYEYGNTVGKVVPRNGLGAIIRRTTNASPEADSVGYSFWGNPTPSTAIIK